MEEHWRVAFETFAERKIQEASASRIQTLTTVVDRNADTPVHAIGNAWTRLHYGGDFGLAVAPPNCTHLSLAFVQSRDGNTEAADPRVFGAGATDKHLIYEGLSRVAADAVLVGARTVHPEAFFSVWHPELIALRESLGFPRHPAQVVVSKRGHVDLASLLFNVPTVPVFLIGGEQCFLRHAVALHGRPWVRPILLADADLRSSLDRLRLESRHSSDFGSWWTFHRYATGRRRSCTRPLSDDRSARGWGIRHALVRRSRAPDANGHDEKAVARRRLANCF